MMRIWNEYAFSDSSGVVSTWPFISTPLDFVGFNHVCFILLNQMLKGRPTIDGRPGESLEPLDFDALKAKLQEDFGETLNLRRAKWTNLYILMVFHVL